MKKKLLILGSTGLIGSACKRHFLNEGSFDLLLPSRKEVDLLNAEQVNRYFEANKPNYVILAAGLVGGIQYNAAFPADFIVKNLTMQLNAFAAANAAEVKKLIFFASSCMYPKVCEQPMREEFLLTGPLEQTSASYAVAKIAGIQMAKAYNQQYQTERFIGLIPNSVYGPNDNFSPEKGHVLSVLLARFHQAKLENRPSIDLWGTGEPRREFLYADDLAAAIGFLLYQSNIPLPLNIGVGYDISIKELAERLAEVVGYKGELNWDATKPNGTLKKLLDNQKINQMGWKPLIRFEEGIAITYQWYLKEQASSNIELQTAK
ncbi:MAG: GDP-L-fucose synthase [Verrucomicrobia bacterium]|nr:GDP-L-fucose synthase [Verrucomicrobiota bacterium]